MIVPNPSDWALRVRLLIATLAMVAYPSALHAEEDLANPETAVKAGQDALESSWELPWYDSTTDGYRPIDLRPPPQRSGFWDWLDGLFSGWNLDLGGVLKFLGWLIVAGLLIWIVVALIRAYLQAELITASEATTVHDARAHVARIEALPVSIDEPVGDFLEAAHLAYESGDLTRAIVYLFSFELLELDRNSLVRLVKGKTNRQYLRELRRGGEPVGRLADILRKTVDVFEAAFFGAHPPTKQSFDECWREAGELRSLLRPREEGSA